MDGNFTVISNEDAILFQKLKEFYKDICDLTLNHDVIDDGSNTTAVVYPRNLGQALEKINTDWHADAFR